MTVDQLDGEIRRMLSEIGDAAGVAPPFDALRVADPRTLLQPACRKASSRGLAAAVVATIAAGLVGIVWFAQREDRPIATTPSLAPVDTAVEPVNSAVAPAPSAPSTLDADEDRPPDTTNAIELAELDADSWLVATWLPEGYELVLATDLGAPDLVSHAVSYENPSGDQIAVTFHMITSDSDQTELSTRPWTREAIDDGYTATASDGSSTVSISADRLDAADFDRLVDGVAVRTRDEIPNEAFLSLADVTDDDIVATYDHNGFPYVMQADGVNGYYCIKSGGSGVCPLWIEPDQVMTSHGGGSTAAMGGSTRITGSASGIVQPVVDRIEVEFIDGQRISVEPTDLTGRFDHEFWIVATDIELDAPVDPDPGASPPRPVLSATAYDRDGNVLYVDHGFAETLIAVVATNGKAGYVDRDAFDEATGANVSPPEEAVEWQRQQDASAGDVVYLPVFLADGVTIIGEFPISPSTAIEIGGDPGG